MMNGSWSFSSIWRNDKYKVEIVKREITKLPNVAEFVEGDQPAGEVIPIIDLKRRFDWKQQP